MNTYEIITKRITEKLEQGIIPWQKPWGNKDGGLPKNLVTKKEYRGINVFMLLAAGHTNEFWLTYNQAKKLGGQIKKGESGYPVIFWKWLDIAKEGENKSETVPMLRYYTVFNVEQCDGIELPKEENSEKQEFSPIESCERLVAGYPQAPSINHGKDQAFYVPSTDTINMPHRELFITPEGYYSTLFHEMTHSVGAEKRLNRKTLTDLCPFGSTNYSREELIAEMGAAFLCGAAGIENKTIDNSAGYIQNWLHQLRNDKTMVIMAAAQAQKAADYIRGLKAPGGEE